MVTSKDKQLEFQIEGMQVLARKLEPFLPRLNPVVLHRYSSTEKLLLESLSDNKISMTKIESIPTRINNWEYMFLLDIVGHENDKNVAVALKDIKKKSIFYKFLGSYPKSI